MLISTPSRRFRSCVALFFSTPLFVALWACSSDMDSVASEEDIDDSIAGMTGAGPCEGTAIDKAVRCAEAKGAQVLSYYRSAAEQERVRRENGCVNRCSGMRGCVRPTADCTTSPHTACRAVDLVNDGAPLTRAELRACGLAKTSLPHANHYDLVR